MAMHSLASVSTPPCSPLSTRRGGNPSNKLLTVTRAVPPSPTTKKPIEKKSRKNLGPGCGLLDWVRLGKSGKDLTGVNGASLCVTEEELAKHCTMDDAWTAIRGVVYNITFYMKFHPGGKEELMEGAGKDCTLLFDEVHSWVKVESMLAKCKVGTLAPRTSAAKVKCSRTDITPSTLAVHHNGNEATSQARIGTAIHVDEDAQPGDEPAGTKQVSPVSPTRPPLHTTTLSSGEGGSVEPVALNLPTVRVRRNSDNNKPSPKMEWHQTQEAVIITIHPQCKNLNLKSTDLIMDIDQKTFEAALFINDWVYDLNLALNQDVASSQVTFNTDNIQIQLEKSTAMHWEVLGSYLPGHGTLTTRVKREPRQRLCTVEEIRDVTHDTKLFRLQLPSGSYFKVPVGHHISLRAKLDDEVISRDYTPVTPVTHLCCKQQVDCVHLMIKLYKDGKMSKLLSQLKTGEKLWISDPQGTFDESRLHLAEKIVMIAAGSGFTPMVRIIQNALQTTRSAKLLFANKTEGDIVWREELDSLTRQGLGFEVIHVLSSAGVAWDGIHGRVTHGLLREHLPLIPLASQKSKICICVCGPTPFLESMSNILLEMQYPVECIHVFS
eukprot:Em0023g820a